MRKSQRDDGTATKPDERSWQATSAPTALRPEHAGQRNRLQEPHVVRLGAGARAQHATTGGARCGELANGDHLRPA